MDLRQALTASCHRLACRVVGEREIEARLFVFTILGEMRQEGRLAQAAVNRQGLVVDLLRMYPLERWHEQGFITEEQLVKWIAQALTLLLPDEGYSTT
jgi:hypothetical protein